LFDKNGQKKKTLKFYNRIVKEDTFYTGEDPISCYVMIGDDGNVDIVRQT